MKRHPIAGSICVLAAMFTPSLCVAQGLPTISSAESASAFGALPTISPGAWIEIYGQNLAIDTRSWLASDFKTQFGSAYLSAPFSLDGSSVTIGGQSACISYISPGQINAQVPFVRQGSNTNQPIIVTTTAGMSAPYSIGFLSAEPGLLAPPSFNVGGTQYVAALFSDGATYAAPPGLIPGAQSRRAHPGDTLTLYGVGFGFGANWACEVSPPNEIGGGFAIKFGPADAMVTYSGLAPGAVGLYQFNVVVPAILSSDRVPVTFTLGGTQGTQTLFIAVENDNELPQLTSFTLSSIFVSGGGTAQGSVTLSAAAPPGGAVVTLLDIGSSSSASFPSTITVPAGATSATFTIPTFAVSSIEESEIIASSGGSSATTFLEVAPPNGAVAINMLPTFLVSEGEGPQIQTPGTINLTSISQGGSNAIKAVFDRGSVILFNAAFNQVDVSGMTISFSQPAASSAISLAFPGGSAAITSGSMTLTFTPPDRNGYGSVTGMFTLKSSALTLTGTITGGYSVLV